MTASGTNPVRRRAVDRCLGRARVAAVGMVTSFGLPVRNEVGPSLLGGALVDAAHDTVGPRRAGPWLRADARSQG